MNKARRESLTGILEEIDTLSSRIEELQDEEAEALNSLPESLQGGERGNQMAEAIEAMQSARDSLAEASSSVEEAIA